MFANKLDLMDDDCDIEGYPLKPSRIDQLWEKRNDVHAQLQATLLEIKLLESKRDDLHNELTSLCSEIIQAGGTQPLPSERRIP